MKPLSHTDKNVGKTMSWSSVLSSSIVSTETCRGVQGSTADAQAILEFKILLLIT